MTTSDYTIEDCLEFLTGLTLMPNQKGPLSWKDKIFTLYPENQKVLYSIGTQVFRGKALTEKQHLLVKKLMLEFYVEQFADQNIDIKKHIDKIREPYREVDKSYWVKRLEKDDKSFIGIRFPFSNSVIEYINDLKKHTDTDYFYDKHVHYFEFNEQNVYKVMNIANKFKERFDVEPSVQEYFDTLVEFDMNKLAYVPGVQNNKFLNVHEELQQHLEAKYPKIDNTNIVSIWDKRRLFGLSQFEEVDISNYSTLSKAILQRKNSSVVVRSDVWNIDQVLNSLHEIDRMPLFIALDPENNPFDHLSTIYNSVKGFINNKDISVMFRLDNKNHEEFNQFIRVKGLNNSIGNNTQIVIANRKKITKPIIQSQWTPYTMLTFGQSRGYGSIFSTYIEQFDLQIYYTKEDSIISTYTRRKESDYKTGITTV